jgi:hypothetical protein
MGGLSAGGLAAGVGSEPELLGAGPSPSLAPEPGCNGSTSLPSGSGLGFASVAAALLGRSPELACEAGGTSLGPR